MATKAKKRLLSLLLVGGMFACVGWDDSAFLAGCLTGAVLMHALDHHRHTTVVYDVDTHYEVFVCPRCNFRYSIVSGTARHTCPNCKTVFVLQE